MRIYKWVLAYLVLLTIFIMMAGCTTPPVSHIYQPPTQAEIDRQESSEAFWKQFEVMNNFGLALRK